MSYQKIFQYKWNRQAENEQELRKFDVRCPQDAVFVVIAGGTGGHVMPALSVGKVLKSRGHNVFYLTDERCQQYFADQENVFIMPFGSLGEKSFKNLGAIFHKMTKGFRFCKKFFKEIKPSALIGFGGYTTFPPLMLGWLLKIPFFLFEPDSSLGIVNQFFAKKAKRIFTGFKNVSKFPKNVPQYWSGLPLRPEFKKSYEERASVPSSPIFTIFVIGGSLGAAIFSHVVPAAIALLPLNIQKNLRIIQQVRSQLHDQTQQAYNKTACQVNLHSFFPQIWQPMLQADLIISRAGASSIAEITFLEKACLFVPFKAAQNDHQKKNAFSLEEKKAAWVMEESMFTPETLSAFLQKIINDPAQRQQRAMHAKEMAKEDAAETIAQGMIDAL